MHSCSGSPVRPMLEVPNRSTEPRPITDGLIANAPSRENDASSNASGDHLRAQFRPRAIARESVSNAEPLEFPTRDTHRNESGPTAPIASLCESRAHRTTHASRHPHSTPESPRKDVPRTSKRRPDRPPRAPLISTGEGPCSGITPPARGPLPSPTLVVTSCPHGSFLQCLRWGAQRGSVLPPQPAHMRAQGFEPPPAQQTRTTHGEAEGAKTGVHRHDIVTRDIAARALVRICRLPLDNWHT